MKIRASALALTSSADLFSFRRRNFEYYEKIRQSLLSDSDFILVHPANHIGDAWLPQVGPLIKRIDNITLNRLTSENIKDREVDAYGPNVLALYTENLSYVHNPTG